MQAFLIAVAQLYQRSEDDLGTALGNSSSDDLHDTGSTGMSGDEAGAVKPVEDNSSGVVRNPVFSPPFTVPARHGRGRDHVPRRNTGTNNGTTIAPDVHPVFRRCELS